MAAPYPDGTIIGIIVMAIIILALFWNDKISTGNGRSSTSTRTRDGGDDDDGTDTTPDTPSTTPETTDPERPEPDTTEPERPDPERPQPEHTRRRPSIEIVDRQIGDNGRVRIVAEAEPASDGTPIVWTKMSINDVQSPDEPKEQQSRGNRFVFEKRLEPSVYHYQVTAKDEKNRKAPPRHDSFQIGGRGQPGMPGRGRPGGAGAPIIYNPQILERRAGNLPDELIAVLEALGESIKESTGDQKVAVELGEELEGLIAVVESLSGQLDNFDISQLVEELQNIKGEIETGSVDISSLEDQIEELTRTVQEQSGITDEEKEFYRRLESKIDELINELDGSPELEELEGLLDITVNPEQSVEVQGLSEEDRALFRRVLNEIGSHRLSEEEIQWFIGQFTEQRQRQNRIFDALEVIWQEMREGEDPASDTGDTTFDFLDDFNAFRNFMEERESRNLDMGPYAASSAFSAAYYSGNISLDHNPVAVVEKISQVAKELSSGNKIEDIIGVTLSRSETNDIRSTVNMYESIESNSKV